jgi:hypothetical protein
MYFQTQSSLTTIGLYALLLTAIIALLSGVIRGSLLEFGISGIICVELVVVLVVLEIVNGAIRSAA